VLRGRISGLLVGDTTNNRITEMRNGVLCGAIPTRDLAALQNPAGIIPGGGGGGMASRSSFLELLVGGQRVLVLNIGPQQPDIDLDGDGLERYEATMGGGSTPPQIRPASTATARASRAAPAPTTRAWPTALARPSSSRRSGSPCAASRAAPPAAAA
jgi:hypothetical protein